MINFKQFGTTDAFGNITPNDNGLKLLLIAKHMHQATPNNVPSLTIMHVNTNGSACWGLLFPSGDLVPCSDYVNDQLFDKIVRYNEWEFKWVGGSPVQRPVPLTGYPLSVRQEQADAYASINFKPTSLVTYLFKRVEQVFGVDLDTF